MEQNQRPVPKLHFSGFFCSIKTPLKYPKLGVFLAFQRILRRAKKPTISSNLIWHKAHFTVRSTNLAVYLIKIKQYPFGTSGSTRKYD